MFDLTNPIDMMALKQPVCPVTKHSMDVPTAALRRPAYLILRDYCGRSTVVDEAYTLADAIAYRASFVQGSGMGGVVRIVRVA